MYSASDRSSDKRSADADYVVDHSIFMYLMDSQGQFAEFYAGKTTILTNFNLNFNIFFVFDI